MSIWQWQDRLPSVDDASRIHLGEGNTSLVRSVSIGARVGLSDLSFKLESANPSGSYKDRFAVMGVSRMVADGKRVCVASSSGNTGAALAACCAAAGVKCVIAAVQGAPESKLQQMLAYGAEVLRIRGFGNDAKITAAVFDELQVIAGEPDAELLISAFAFSPEAMCGVKTISFELLEQMSRKQARPCHVFVPAGGGGLTLAIARGFREVVRSGDDRRVHVHCVQPAGNDTIASPLRRGDAAARCVQCQTGISGLQVPSVVDGDEVIAACRESGGTGHVVTDEDIYAAQRALARSEGILCEPAAATALAGAIKAAEHGDIGSDDQVICIVTGHGFKDQPSMKKLTRDSVCPIIGIDGLADFIQQRSDA